MVLEATAGRVTSSKDMTAHEMQRAISMLGGKKESSIAKMRAKLRALAVDIGLVVPIATQPGKHDYSRLDKWMQRQYKKTSLFQLTDEQLRSSITALENWRNQKTKKELEL